MTQPIKQPDFKELFTTFGKIGLLSFGGPAAQIAMLQRIIVDEKKWMDQERLIHALNFCMLLPGPEAMQLATYAGWAVKGWRGGLLAGLLFVLPGAAVMLALSAIYIAFGHVDVVAGLLFGLKAAVLAVVFEALYRMGKRTLASGFSYCVAIAAFIAIALLKLPFPLVVLLAAVAGGLRHVVQGNGATTVLGEATPGALREFTQQTVIWGGLWLLPLVLLYMTFGGAHVFAQEAGFFSKLAAVTFGGAYAVLSYTAQQAVDHFNWMKPGEMLTGLGLAETTPGPLILVLVFVGFVGAANLSGLPPLAGGVIGGLIALWFTFVPCFLWILAGAPFVERLRQVRWLSAMLGGITAAVVGVIANLALWFSLHVIFAQVVEKSVGPFALPVPVWSTIDNAAVLIAGAAAFLLVVLKLNMPLVLLLAACLGIVIRLVF
ncbi:MULTISPECIES: chromate efflux transporter [unclassified Ochrobactrum]|uniref:chromate efflux transporter n=1 Tax=unclassified Ochrobactrum TaxID=239106 RepID=UPI000DF00EE7|nr:chromate efflux transporter [Ochrobactrum sp. 3-3]MBQ0708860.1 chromate efflux transporter [Ochrobactrum sp. AP1BH01-1]